MQDIVSPQSGQATRHIAIRHISRWVCQSLGYNDETNMYQLPSEVREDARQLTIIGEQVIATSLKRFANGKPLAVSQTKPQIAMGLTPSMVEELGDVLRAIVVERLNDVAQQLEQCQNALNQ